MVKKRKIKSKRVSKKSKPRVKRKSVSKNLSLKSKKTKTRRTTKREELSKISRISKKKIHKTVIPDINNPTEVKNFLLKDNYKHHLESHSNSNGFFKNLFSGSGFYRFTLFPIVVLLFVTILDFLMQLLVHVNFSPQVILMSKNYIGYSLFVILITFASFICYFYMGYEGARHNFRFNRIFITVFNIVIAFFVLNIILLFIGYLTFMKPYISYFYTENTKFCYLLYLFIWKIIKSVILLFVTSLSYLIFTKSKYLKYK